MKAWLLTLFALFAFSQSQLVTDVLMRFFHGHPAIPEDLTLLIDGIPLHTGIGYEEGSFYANILPGVHTLSVVRTSGNSTTPLASLTIIVATGNTYSAVFYGNQGQTLCLLVDSPTAFVTQVRFVHLSECVGPVQPLIGFVDAGTFPAPLPYGGVTDYVPVPFGTFSVGFRDATTFVALISIPFAYVPGTSSTVYLTGCPGTAEPLSMIVVTDQSPFIASVPASVPFGFKK
jgi:hypothetical protein